MNSACITTEGSPEGNKELQNFLTELSELLSKYDAEIYSLINKENYLGVISPNFVSTLGMLYFDASKIRKKAKEITSN